jgi:hypothetical protein
MHPTAETRYSKPVVSTPISARSPALHPLEVLQVIEECFDQSLATAAAIADPFEQAFFVMCSFPVCSSSTT